MSMPAFLDELPDVGREAATNQIIASIALEELSLSHILNSEGEKIQFVLGTLEAAEGVDTRPLAGDVTVDNLIALDQSVVATLQAAAAYQAALLEKLQAVLAAIPAGEE